MLKFIDNIMQKYIRLLSYDNACKLIIFINKNDENDYANITPGGVSIQFSDKNWNKIETFIKSLNVRYEICDEPPYIVTQKTIDKLKKIKILQ